MKEADKNSGKKTDYINFAKLIGKGFEYVRVTKTLLILTIWDTANTGVTIEKFPTEKGLWDLFTTHKYPRYR